MELLLGPVFSAGEPTYSPPAEMLPTGVVMEITGPTTWIRLPIYKAAKSSPSAAYSDTGLYFVWDADFTLQRWPSAFSIKPHQWEVINMVEGNFFCFSAILSTLYTTSWNLIPLPFVLDDFCLRFDFQLPQTIGKRPVRTGMLIPRMEDQGLVLSLAFSHNQKTKFGIGYVPECYRSGVENGISNVFNVMEAELSVQAGKFTEGVWAPESPRGIADCLRNEFKKYTPKTPLQCLTPLGAEILLAEMELTPCLLLDKAELEAARLDFVNAHPELRTDPFELARQLREQGYYRKNATIPPILQWLAQLGIV